MTPHQRRLLRLAFWVYLLFIAAVVFQPQPEVASGVVGGIGDLLVRVGAPDMLVAGARVEFVINAAMFAPISFLGHLGFGTRHWANWVAYTFVGSLTIELVQGLLLADRSAQFVDVVSNTLGGLVGAVVGVALRLRLSYQDGRKDRRSIP